MAKTTCIIVEDEPLAVRVLKEHVAHVPFLKLVRTFRDAIQATDYLRLHRVDLMFLDLHLPVLKGMAFLRTLSDPPTVIVTTAHHEYALEGFELGVKDYLLKPISFDRFLAAVTKVEHDRRHIREGSAGMDRNAVVVVGVKKKRVRIALSDICFVESQREYVRIVTTRREYVTKMSTREIEALLPRGLFARIHRSFIVSVDKVESFTAETVDVQGRSIPIGKAYRKEAQVLMGSRGRKA